MAKITDDILSEKCYLDAGQCELNNMIPYNLSVAHFKLLLELVVMEAV